VSARKLTPGRLRAMRAIAFGVLGMTSIEKEQLVLTFAPGKTSFRKLTNAEADRVIDDLKRRANQTVMRPQPRERRRVRAGAVTGDVDTLVTPAQRMRLADLSAELLLAGVTGDYLRGVHQRSCGRPAPHTSYEAEKSIEALKGVLARVGSGRRPSA
jgi:hypothetical protein